MHNVEIKVPLDDPGRTLRALEALGARFQWERQQEDTFFPAAEGWLKLRCTGDGVAELIAYTRPPGTEPRPSDYDVTPVNDGDAMRNVLARSLGVRGTVRKRRRLYLLRHTRIHLDEVEGLGSFLELETVVREISLEEAQREAEEIIEALGLDRSRFLGRPYLELLEGLR